MSKSAFRHRESDSRVHVLNAHATYLFVHLCFLDGTAPCIMNHGKSGSLPSFMKGPLTPMAPSVPPYPLDQMFAANDTLLSPLVFPLGFDSYLKEKNHELLKSEC